MTCLLNSTAANPDGQAAMHMEAYVLTAASPLQINGTASRNRQAVCLRNTGCEDILVTVCNRLAPNQDLDLPSALAYQQLLLMALEQQNWPSAASFALLLCKAIATEAAVGLAIALLAARRSQTGSETMPPGASQLAQRVRRTAHCWLRWQNPAGMHCLNGKDCSCDHLIKSAMCSLCDSVH